MKCNMPRSKIAISLDEAILESLDTLVEQPPFAVVVRPFRRQWRKHSADANYMAGIVRTVLTPASFRMLKKAVQQGRSKVGDATNKERHVCGRARVGERPVSWGRRNLSHPPPQAAVAALSRWYVEPLRFTPR